MVEYIWIDSEGGVRSKSRVSILTPFLSISTLIFGGSSCSATPDGDASTRPGFVPGLACDIREIYASRAAPPLRRYPLAQLGSGSSRLSGQ
jgi:hypothetical protein